MQEYPKRAVNRYSEADKHAIIKAYLGSNRTKQSIWQEFTGQAEEHGKILKWMRQLGYTLEKICTFTEYKTPVPMSNKPVSPSDSDFEKQQLEKRVAELEKQLKEAEMKAIAFSTMVDIAEKEFKIPIRKKYNTKP